MYWGTAVEFRDRQKFPRHAKAWGPFLHPTSEEVVKRYLEKCHKKEAAAPLPAPQPSVGEASSTADAPAALTATPTAAVA